MFTVKVMRPGRMSMRSVKSFLDAIAFASEVIVLGRGDTFEISIVDESTQTEVSNYSSWVQEWRREG